MSTELPVKVMFRTWKKGGDVEAIFPEIPHDSTGHKMVVYSSTVQHCSGDRFYFQGKTRRSSPEEIETLRVKLWAAGYHNLKPVLRITAAMDQTRLAAALRP